MDDDSRDTLVFLYGESFTVLAHEQKITGEAREALIKQLRMMQFALSYAQQQQCDEQLCYLWRRATTSGKIRPWRKLAKFIQFHTKVQCDIVWIEGFKWSEAGR